MKTSTAAALCAAVLWLGVGCQKKDDAPPNPFDAYKRGGGKIEIDPPDSASLVGLHTYIFSRSCAQPACHDGSFEPDFRTVQSTYSTLVFQPVVKNNSQRSFQYRVVPGNVEKSWLYERVVTDDGVLGRMPLYDRPLDESQLRALRRWIAAGAPDMFGNPARSPNRLPDFKGYAAFLYWEGLYEWRCDTARGGNPGAPFYVRKGWPVEFWFEVEDDSTAVENLTVNELWLSSDRYDYSAAKKLKAEYVPTPRIIKDFHGPGKDGVFHWRVKTNDVPMEGDQLIFMRYRVCDGVNPEIEVPTSAASNGVFFYHSFWLGN
ncbi:MAG: hypothetical protein RMM53_00320 [Bacteroidia bacterium]|nr:hypothetical protein [Bacteroidia bacterium]MDW8332638.1 hypothetical protein [Bacteroidia bacterium]